MCNNCKLVLERHKGAIIMASKKHKPFHYKWDDFNYDIRTNYLFQKQKNPDLENVGSGYFYKIAENLKNNFFRDTKKYIELNEEHKNFVDIKKIHDVYFKQFVEDIIKFLKEEDIISQDEIAAFLSASQGESIEDYLSKLDVAMKSNSAGTKRRRAVEKIAKYIKDNPEFIKNAEKLNLNEA